jgi:hypothetical protein
MTLAKSTNLLLIFWEKGKEIDPEFYIDSRVKSTILSFRNLTVKKPAFVARNKCKSRISLCSGKGVLSVSFLYG